MKNLGKPHQIRLNPTEETLLSQLMEEHTADETKARIEYLTNIDREGRAGYRNHSGRKPALASLLLRRAIQIGLPQVAEELHQS